RTARVLRQRRLVRLPSGRARLQAAHAPARRLGAGGRRPDPGDPSGLRTRLRRPLRGAARLPPRVPVLLISASSAPKSTSPAGRGRLARTPISFQLSVSSFL